MLAEKGRGALGGRDKGPLCLVAGSMGVRGLRTDAVTLHLVHQEHTLTFSFLIYMCVLPACFSPHFPTFCGEICFPPLLFISEKFGVRNGKEES